jgi:hypothetical protein
VKSMCGATSNHPFLGFRQLPPIMPDPIIQTTLAPYVSLC